MGGIWSFKKYRVSNEPQASWEREGDSAVCYALKHPASKGAFLKFLEVKNGPVELVECFQGMEKIKTLSNDQMAHAINVTLAKYQLLHQHAQYKSEKTVSFTMIDNLWESFSILKLLDLHRATRSEVFQGISSVQSHILTELRGTFEQFLSTAKHEEWKVQQLKSEKSGQLSCGPVPVERLTHQRSGEHLCGSLQGRLAKSRNSAAHTEDNSMDLVCVFPS